MVVDEEQLIVRQPIQFGEFLEVKFEAPQVALHRAAFFGQLQQRDLPLSLAPNMLAGNLVESALQPAGPDMEPEGVRATKPLPELSALA